MTCHCGQPEQLFAESKAVREDELLCAEHIWMWGQEYMGDQERPDSFHL